MMMMMMSMMMMMIDNGSKCKSVVLLCSIVNGSARIQNPLSVAVPEFKTHCQWQCENSKPIASAAFITSSLVSF
jgi:hypothetical protein